MDVDCDRGGRDAGGSGVRRMFIYGDSSDGRPQHQLSRAHRQPAVSAPAVIVPVFTPVIKRPDQSEQAAKRHATECRTAPGPRWRYSV